MARVFCIANQKGGVGKTTTAVNLAAGLALTGQRVLMIDLDPQGNATMGSGIDKRALALSVYDLLLESAGVVSSAKRGRERIWTLDPRALSAAGDYLDTLSRQWDHGIDRLRALVERD